MFTMSVFLDRYLSEMPDAMTGEGGHGKGDWEPVITDSGITESGINESGIT